MQRRVFLLAVFCASAVPFAQGQAPPVRLTFEVATIKPSDPGMQSGGIKPLPGGDG